MTNLKNLTATIAAVAVVALGAFAYAQDDLDDLLKDLEEGFASGGTAAEVAEPVAEAEEEVAPAAEESPVAEAEAEAIPADEEAVVPEADAEEPVVEAEEEVAPEAEETVEPEVEAEEEPAPEAEETVEPEVEAEEEPAPEAEETVAPEADAEEPVAEAEEEVAPETEEEPVAETEEEVAPEAVAEEPAEAPVAEEPAPANKESADVAIDQVDAALEMLRDLAAEVEATESTAEETVTTEAEATTEEEVDAEEAPDTAESAPAAATPAAQEPAPAPAAEPQMATPPSHPDAELLASIRATEKLRREAYDIQAMREIGEARAAMKNKEYTEAARHYGIAAKLLNDRPASKKLRRECDQGIAEGLYRAAMEEDQTGRRDRAIKLMEKAIDMRHPKARKQMEEWLSGDDPNANKTNYSQISHRKNDADFKTQREANRKHLRRARQLLSVREIDKALDECELVLLNDPYNQEALRLRRAIISKRALILGQEFQVAREGMIAEVDRAWRPVYAPNASKLESMSSTTVKNALGDDPERSQEQAIINRMKEMRLPEINFKPPASLSDAIDTFIQMSKDYDRPDLPLEKRGFDIMLKPPEALSMASGGEESEDSDDFSATDNDEEEAGPAVKGVPPIPNILARDISFYEALRLVCESVNYKFKVKGQMIMIMHKDQSVDEMIVRSYPVVSAFMDRMESASSDVEEAQASGFGATLSNKRKRTEEDMESQEARFKQFFTLLGVKWPEGSSIVYIKTIGKLRVKNTYDNLADLEKALTEMNADPRLVEIEARFVEVEQEDLNSLGFEWILNSNYALNTGKLGRWAGVKNGTYDSSGNWVRAGGSSTTTSSAAGGAAGSSTTGGGSTTTGGGSSSASTTISGTPTTRSNVGVNAFGGTSDYQNGNRYLSTTGNHVSGSGNSNNDQFMRVNAFLGSADLSMILHMLSQRSDTDLLSAPKILTKPGEEAVIKVVTEFIYPTDYDVQLQSSSSSSSSSSGSQSAILAVVEPQSFTMREVGVILTCTPALTDDGNLVDLTLSAQVVDEPVWKNYGMRIPYSGNASSLTSFEGIGDIFTSLAELIDTVGGSMSSTVKESIINQATESAMGAMGSLSNSGSDSLTYYEAPMEQPFFHVRSIDSKVSVFPGATIVMGGLITESRSAMDDKIPFLGDLPFIGRLFRSHAEKTRKRNLLIFVTTRLVDVYGREIEMGGSAADDTDEVKSAPTATEG